MKKVLAIVLALIMVLCMAACGGEKKEAKTLYVLGPTPDHGWTAQAGTYAQAKCEELKKAGFNAVYMAGSNGEQQADFVNQIIANKDAGLVVIQALDDTAQPAVEALANANIPFIQFDRFIDELKPKAALNYSGDNEMCGAGIASWLQKNGMKAGDVVVVLYGDQGSVCRDRETGFRAFLKGEMKYVDNETKTEVSTTETWTDDQLNAVFNTYSVVCDWGQDKARAYVEQNLGDIVDKAIAGNKNLYIYSMDDEMTFGVLSYLETADAAIQAKVESCNLYISAIGGMQELYDVMLGKAGQSAVADKYFDGMMSVSFNPSMMKSAIDYGKQFIEGTATYKTGDQLREPVFIVDKTNAANHEGFAGH